MFNIGDFIVYPMHGAGTIDSIEEKNILGEKQSYYILRMPGEVKVMVPTNKAEQVGIRKIIDESATEGVFARLEREEVVDDLDTAANWNKKYRDNIDKIKTGDIYEVADVVRNLSYKQKEKGLSTGEKKMLSNAKQILVSELVLAEHSSYEEIDNRVNNKINQSFKEFKITDDQSPIANVVNKFIPFNE